MVAILKNVVSIDQTFHVHKLGARVLHVCKIMKFFATTFCSCGQEDYPLLTMTMTVPTHDRQLMMIVQALCHLCQMSQLVLIPECISFILFLDYLTLGNFSGMVQILLRCL